MSFKLNKFLAQIVVILLIFSSMAPATASTESDAAWVTNIAKARALILKKQFKEAETLLNSTLPQARKHKSDSNYGRYIGLMGNALFSQNKSEQMIPYAEEALRVFYALPESSRPQASVLFANHSDLAISYQAQGELQKAEMQYQKAIDIAASAPKDQIDQNWLKICFKNLIFCLHADSLPGAEQNVREQMKKMVGD